MIRFGFPIGPSGCSVRENWMERHGSKETGMHSLKGCVEMRIVQGIKIGAFDLAEREKMVTSG